jgi:iron(III) transport system substrate-binding protein
MSIRTIALAAITIIAITPSTHALTSEEIVNYRGADRQQVLVDGARKEGQVVLYSALIVNQMLRPLAAGFMKKYPFIKMTYYRADSEELLAKLSAETRASNVVADIFEGSGGGEIAVEAGFTQAFYSPVLDDYPKMYLDPKGHLAPTRLSYFSIAYNTKQVAADKVPKTYEDLTDPQWQGKMAWPAQTAIGAPLFVTNLRIAWGEDKAMAYLQRLAKQNIINFGAGTPRNLVDRVIAGEYPIALQIFAHHPLISAGKGAPVTSQLLPPVASAAGSVLIPKDVRHPNAALLLMDFLLSREGQQILASSEYLPVREDVEPLKQIAPIVPSRAGVAENFISPEKLQAYTESSTKIVETLFR